MHSTPVIKGLAPFEVRVNPSKNNLGNITIPGSHPDQGTGELTAQPSYNRLSPSPLYWLAVRFCLRYVVAGIFYPNEWFSLALELVPVTS